MGWFLRPLIIKTEISFQLASYQQAQIKLIFLFCLTIPTRLAYEMSFDTLRDQNDQMLAFLNNENFSEAIESSYAAIRDLRDLVGTVPSTSMEAASEKLDDYMIVLQDLGAYRADTSRPFIYHHGIPIPSTIPDTKIIAAILIFNAALAQHLSVMSQHGTPSSTPEGLVKAKKLYETIWSCRHHLSLKDNVLFQFALINNIAVINQELGNTVQANTQFDHLISLLNRLEDQI